MAEVWHLNHSSITFQLSNSIYPLLLDSYLNIYSLLTITIINYNYFNWLSITFSYVIEPLFPLCLVNDLNHLPITFSKLFQLFGIVT